MKGRPTKRVIALFVSGLAFTFLFSCPGYGQEDIVEPAFIKGMKELQLPVMYRSGKDLDAYVFQMHGYFSKLFKELGLTK